MGSLRNWLILGTFIGQTCGASFGFAAQEVGVDTPIKALDPIESPAPVAFGPLTEAQAQAVVVKVEAAYPTPSDVPAAPAVTPSGLPATPSPERFKIGDIAFKLRKSEDQARLAAKSYKEVLDADIGDVEAGWRYGMACYFLGIRVAKTQPEKTTFFAEGRDAALFAAVRDPKCAPCHFWAAVNMALFAQEEGYMKTLFSLKEIQKHLEASIEVDPKYMYSGAYRTLGLINQKLPSMLGGNKAKAREYFDKALAGSPDEPLNYLFYGKFIADVEKDLPRALEVAKRGAALEGIGPERIEAQEAVEELKQVVVSKKF